MFKLQFLIENGIIEFQGSGGNHTITFTNDGYSYIVSVFIIGEANGIDATLEVLKGDKHLMSENGTIKRN